MGTDKRLDTIMESTGFWFKENKAGIYIKHIQSEQVFNAGWLLYSVQSMDLKKLQRELEHRLGYSVHARWQMVNTGHNKDLRDEDKIRAIHLRVDDNLQEEALADLASMYSSTAKNFPLGHCMRLIPPVDRMMNPSNIAKFAELRHRQRNFQSNMSRISSWEIATLHSDSLRVPIDLQQRIMHVDSPSFPGSPLFHCVDKPNAKAPGVFWCHPQDNAFARSIVAGLIAYLRHQIRGEMDSSIIAPYSIDENKYMARHLYRFFLPQAVKRSLSCEWSEEEGGVTSREETSAMQALEIDVRYKFDTAPTAEPIIMDRTIDAAILPPAQYQQQETDSISTFAARKPTTIIHPTSPNNSVMTDNTAATTPKGRKKRSASPNSILSKDKSTRSKGSKSTRTSHSAGEDTSDLTSSVDILATNVSAMQKQIMSIIHRFDSLIENASNPTIQPVPPPNGDSA